MIRSPAVGAVAQYAVGGVRERIEAALRGAGKDFDALTPADLAGGLASFEHFHSLGRTCTTALLDAAHVTAGDPGPATASTIGGTARLLAAEYGCRVTAVDLTAEYCDTARWLNGLVQLAARHVVTEGDGAH